MRFFACGVLNPVPLAADSACESLNPFFGGLFVMVLDWPLAVLFGDLLVGRGNVDFMAVAKKKTLCVHRSAGSLRLAHTAHERLSKVK